VGGWVGWQLLRQNGRMLLRLDELEKRLEELEFGEPTQADVLANGQTGNGVDVDPLPEGGGEAQDRANRFSKRSLARSKIKRDGLKAGTPAPDFRLPGLDGTECSLQDFRGRRVLLVFSDPHCSPCQSLAPELETFHREHPEVSLVMISRGAPKVNRTKVKEHGLTFPVLLQQQWEISRRYALFATPIAYLIDEAGIIAQDVAIGVDPVLKLVKSAAETNLLTMDGLRWGTVEAMKG
jgi:peroxiredoxin